MGESQNCVTKTQNPACSVEVAVLCTVWCVCSGRLTADLLIGFTVGTRLPAWTKQQCSAMLSPAPSDLTHRVNLNRSETSSEAACLQVLLTVAVDMLIQH